MIAELDVNAIPDDEWETLTSAGRELAQHMDAGRWLAGDLAGQIVDTHGEKVYNSGIRNAPAQLRTAGSVSHRSQPVTTPIIPVSPDPDNLKQCRWCEQFKPLIAFGRETSEPDGLRPYCKECMKADYRARVARLASAGYVTPDMITCRKCGREKPMQSFSLDQSNPTGRCRECKQCQTEARAQYMQRPGVKERQKASSRKSRSVPERREKLRVRSQNRRRMHGAKDISIRVIVGIYNAQGGRCYLCGNELTFEYEVDHFIPVVLGGTNDPGNLRLACKECNRNRKCGKHPFELGILI